MRDARELYDNFISTTNLSKNEEMFADRVLEDKYPIDAVLIETNNSAFLQNRSKEQLEEASKFLIEKEGYSLFDEALLYGDLEAIKVLVDSGMRIPNEEMALKRYLKELFTQYGRIRSQQNFKTELQEKNSYNKSVPNLIEIFQYLESHVAKGNHVLRDKNMINSLIVEAAKGKELTTLEALLKLNTIDNVNIEDNTGKTALYYLQKRETTKPDEREKLENLITDLTNRGAKLSANDEKALKQEKLTTSFIEMVRREDIQAAQSLIKSNPEQLNLTTIHKAMLDNKIEPTDEMNYAIATTVHRTFDYDNRDFATRLSTYGHRIGLNGEIQVGPKKYKLESSSGPNTRIMLDEPLQNFSSQNEVFRPCSNAISFISNVDQLVKDRESAKQLCYKYYAEGHGMILESGWHNHGIGIAVKYDKQSNKSYVSVSNRGDGGLNACLTNGTKEKLDKIPSSTTLSDTGTIVYELDGKLDPSFFGKLNTHSSLNAFSNEIFRGASPFQNELNNQLKNAKPIAVLPARPQTHATCSYVNQKRSIEGLLLIEAICNGKVKEINKDTLADIYDQYKLFSVEDKQQAVRSLITYYKTCKEDPSANLLEIVNELIFKIITLHHSSKYNEIELTSAKELVSLLPNEMKTQILFLVPELATQTFKHDRMAQFSAQRDRPRDKIIIEGDSKSMFKHSELINNLEDYLNKNDIKGNKVTKIKIEENELTIYTTSQPVNNVSPKDIKYNIKDNIFGNKGGLNASVQNVEGRFQFIINNLEDLSEKLLERKREDKKPR